jgi:hypothetical protein
MCQREQRSSSSKRCIKRSFSSIPCGRFYRFGYLSVPSQQMPPYKALCWWRRRFRSYGGPRGMSSYVVFGLFMTLSRMFIPHHRLRKQSVIRFHRKAAAHFDVPLDRWDESHPSPTRLAENVKRRRCVCAGVLWSIEYFMSELAALSGILSCSLALADFTCNWFLQSLAVLSLAADKLIIKMDIYMLN